MHDPKLSEKEVQRFELEVQQKMEELEFSPSAAVWANVEKAVRVEKKRRVPFFWLFFLPALLLIGGTGIYLMGSHPSPSSLHTDRNSAQIQNPVKGSGGSNDRPGNDRPGNDQPVSGQQANDQQTSVQPINSQQTKDQPSNDQPAKVSQPAKSEQPFIGQSASEQSSTAQSARSDRPAKPGRSHVFSHHPTGTTGKETGQPLTSRSLTAQTLTTRPLTDKPLTEEESGFPDQPLIGASIHLNPVNLKNIAAIQAAPLAKKTTLATTRLTPKRAWEAGFTGGIGMSSLNQTLFKSSAVTANDTRNLAAPVAVTGLTATKNYVSKIRPDLSFWAGIFLQKPILNNLSVSVGLNLHYYSAKVYTGDKVVNNASNYYYSPATSLLASAAAPTPAQYYPYYTAGDNQTFINRYYFLEIPGSIQWQISHNRIMPLFWEVGGTLSYLMSSNAIYYNTKAGVYYKDGNVSNKTQFNLSTALMVGIPFSGLQMQVGPQLQYGVTNLLNTQNSGGQHLFYGGLKLVIFPGKLHKSSKHLFREQ
ncbi:MAG TPA: outer membrane beta-barrel protein [Puia sp.]|nr:outer membrane beta-barrel protein [Puia sp.]